MADTVPTTEELMEYMEVFDRMKAAARADKDPDPADEQFMESWRAKFGAEELGDDELDTDDYVAASDDVGASVYEDESDKES